MGSQHGDPCPGEQIPQLPPSWRLGPKDRGAGEAPLASTEQEAGGWGPGRGGPGGPCAGWGEGWGHRRLTDMMGLLGHRRGVLAWAMGPG